MRVISFFKAHARLRRLLIGAVSAMALFTVLGFLVVPALARSIGQRKLSEFLHRQVTIEQVQLNPYALSATVRGLRIRDRDGARNLFALKELYVNLQLASLFKGGVVVRQLRVVEPAISLVRTAEDRYNFSDILDELAAQPPSPPRSPSDKPARFSLSNIELINGRVDLDDRFKTTQHQITGVNISVPFVSNFPYLVETFVQPAFSATINGTRLALKGRTKPFAESLESSLDVNLAQVDLPFYLAYVPVKLKPKLRSAVLDTNLKVTFIQYRDRPPRVDVSGRVALSDLNVVDDIGRPLLKMPLLEVTIASSDLLSNKLAVERVLLQSPVVHLRRDKRGEMQLQSLLPSAPPPQSGSSPAPALAKAPPAGKTTPAGPARPWLIEIAEAKIDAARIVFTDASNPRPFAASVDPLTVSLRNFTTAKGGQATLALAATTDANESIRIEGRLGVAPVAFDGTVTARGLPLARYAPYYTDQILFDLRQGTLDLSIPLRLGMKGTDLDLTVKGLQIELRDLQLRRHSDREDFLRLPELSIRDTNFDLGRHELVLGDVATSGARLRLERSGNGQPWNLEMLMPAAPPAGPPVRATAAPARTGQLFAVTVQKFDLKGWAVRIEDRAPRTAAVIAVDRIAVRVEGLSTERGRQGRVSLQARVNQSGVVNVSGALGITPLSANLQLLLKTIPIVPVQPYFEDSVALLVTGGHVGANGRVTLLTSPRGPGVTYKGEISVGDVVAVDPSSTEELVRLGGLRISGIDAVSEPFKLNVAEIEIKDYAASVVINPDHTINLAKIAKGAGPAPAAQPAPPATTGQPTPTAPPATSAPPAVRIAAVVLQGGTISITDRSIHPAFATSLSDLGGRVAGLSFDQNERADVDIKGRLGSGPLHISGRMNPLAEQRYIDIAFKLADLDMSAMTPYSGKYAGYAVDKGQLALDIKCLIEARKLDAKNSVRIDQFTFGHSVDSKDATRLPVRLAVSLLKDRRGVIRLDMPVSGSLDDPKFSVWGVVFMVLKNLLIKAATSPFALLGSLFGGGEELAYLEFEPGRSDVLPAGRARLDTLAKALYERPGLRLEAEGHADPARDLEALRRLELKRRVTAQKVKDTVASGSDANSAVVVSEAEYPKYLKLAYGAEKFAKPKNAIGMVKDVPVAEMERLMLAAIVVNDDDLRLLARQRAQGAREAILRGKKIETERVFVVEPKSIPPQHKEQVGDSRVDFRLQ